MTRRSNHNQPLLTGIKRKSFQKVSRLCIFCRSNERTKRENKTRERNDSSVHALSTITYSNKQTNSSSVINRTFHYGSEFDEPSIADYLINKGSIVFDCRPFDNRTFDFVRVTKFLGEFDLVRFSNRIERLLFDFVRSPERSIRYAGN